MAKRTREKSTGQMKLVPSREQIEEQIREELRTRMRASMLEVVYAMFEEEKEQLCGKPWARKEPGQGRRGGTEKGSVYFEGQRVPVTYPRVVDEHGSRAVGTYQALRSYDLLDPEVQTRLMRGVSTRDYSQVITKLAEGTGLGKDTVSRAFIRASKRSLEEINGRDLSKHLFVAVFIDGISFGKDTTLVVAMGVTLEGQKVLLGLQEGHTENSTVVGTLLDNLADRKLALTDRFLAVLDGAKALKAAVLARWKGRVVIQRCQVHKKRNVCEHLTPPYARELKRRLNAAYGLASYEEAKKFMDNTLRWLEQISEPAAASLREGLEETLTVVKLGLPDLLRKTFSSTNPIESILEGVRYRTHRVKRWRTGKGQMVARWASSALLVVEKRLHKVKGASLLNSLVQALAKVDVLEKVG
jgi:putative transposase